MTQRDACGLADPDDSWLKLLALLVVAVVVLAWGRVWPGVRWVWRTYLSSIIFLLIIATLAGYACLVIRYRG